MQKYDVAAYIWPAYTGDEPRTRMFWPEGMGEWQSVKNSRSKYPSDTWPRRPLWGYVNEADPAVMEMQINVAADHGVPDAACGYTPAVWSTKYGAKPCSFICSSVSVLVS